MFVGNMLNAPTPEIMMKCWQRESREETQMTYLVPHREAAAPAKLQVCQNHF